MSNQATVPVKRPNLGHVYRVTTRTTAGELLTYQLTALSRADARHNCAAGGDDVVSVSHVTATCPCRQAVPA